MDRALRARVISGLPVGHGLAEKSSAVAVFFLRRRPTGAGRATPSLRRSALWASLAARDGSHRALRARTLGPYGASLATLAKKIWRYGAGFLGQSRWLHAGAFGAAMA